MPQGSILPQALEDLVKGYREGKPMFNESPSAAPTPLPEEEEDFWNLRNKEIPGGPRRNRLTKERVVRPSYDDGEPLPEGPEGIGTVRPSRDTPPSQPLPPGFQFPPPAPRATPPPQQQIQPGLKDKLKRLWRGE